MSRNEYYKPTQTLNLNFFIYFSDPRALHRKDEQRLGNVLVSPYKQVIRLSPPKKLYDKQGFENAEKSIAR